MSHRLLQGNNLDILPSLPSVRCIFADPPDNIGLGYDTYKDKLQDEQYVELMERWIKLFVSKADITWLSFNARWTIEVGEIIAKLRRDGNEALECKPCVQVFTFGQHNNNDLGNNHRPLYRLRWEGKPLHPNDIRVASWRQRNGDPRASSKGRVPGDVFDMQYPSTECTDIGGWLSAALDDPQASPEFKAAVERWFNTHCGDVFDFPRVTGNSKQRQDWHPTQLHEDLVERCIKLSTQPGEPVLDPFGGTGTTLRVCKKIGRPCTLIELDPFYCAKIAELEGLTVEQIKRAA